MAGTGNATYVDSDFMEFAPLIILLPMLAFPIILFLGRVFNRNPFWKDKMKEGGIIALVVMAASLMVSLLLIKDHLGSFLIDNDTIDFLWLNTHTYSSSGLAEHTLGFGLYVDHITVMLLFVASFLCLLINIFSIGYMNTDPINDNRNHRFYAEFVLFCSGIGRFIPLVIHLLGDYGSLFLPSDWFLLREAKRCLRSKEGVFDHPCW